MKVLYSGFADRSHSSFGGYHNIVNFPHCGKVLLSRDYFLGELDRKYRLRKIPLTLLDLDTRRQRRNYDITHLFYGEITMIPFLPYPKDKKHKTVITLHLDIEKQRFHKFFLKNLSFFDGIIVLSTQQQEYYRNKYGIETAFIPHGFDTPTFSYKIPRDTTGRSIDTTCINLITSGKNYRDFDTLKATVEKFRDDERFVFHLIGTPAEVKKDLSQFPNVHIYPRIDNDEYYSLIKSCDYGFLPVTFATANNALLETQAIGLKSILPNIAGIQDYAAEANLFYSSTEELFSLIDSLHKSTISEEILQHAKKFLWKNIFNQLNEYYSNLLSI